MTRAALTLLLAFASSAVPSAAGQAAGFDLRLGEYACVGFGGRILAGLGFKVLGGRRYVDLDGGSPGTFSVDGDGVLRFSGGHLDGQVGRVSPDGSATVGPTSCSPTA